MDNIIDSKIANKNKISSKSKTLYPGKNMLDEDNSTNQNLKTSNEDKLSIHRQNMINTDKSSDTILIKKNFTQKNKFTRKTNISDYEKKRLRELDSLQGPSIGSLDSNRVSSLKNKLFSKTPIENKVSLFAIKNIQVEISKNDLKVNEKEYSAFETMSKLLYEENATNNKDTLKPQEQIDKVSSSNSEDVYNNEHFGYKLYTNIKFVIDELQSDDMNSMTMVAIQVCNSIIRYTFLTFPYCFAMLGLINGCAIVTVISLMSIVSLYFILKSHEVTGYK